MMVKIITVLFVLLAFKVNRSVYIKTLHVDFADSMQ